MRKYRIAFGSVFWQALKIFNNHYLGDNVELTNKNSNADKLANRLASLEAAANANGKYEQGDYMSLGESYINLGMMAKGHYDYVIYAKCMSRAIDVYSHAMMYYKIKLEREAALTEVSRHMLPKNGKVDSSISLEIEIRTRIKECLGQLVFASKESNTPIQESKFREQLEEENRIIAKLQKRDLH